MVNILRIAAPDLRLVTEMRLAAAMMNYNGKPTPAAQRHMRRCTRYHEPTQALMIYTRDAGMHSSGWWKNPDYERCLHLSLSFAAIESPISWQRLPFDRKMGAKWAEAFFGEHVSKLWLEGPFSDEGKACDVHHYRLFCDPSWTPMLPRGEVYSKEFTELGWKSWSDVHGVDNGDGAFGASMEAANA